MSSRAAIRYAKAMLQQANETKTQEVVFGDMQSVYDTLQGSRDLQMALQSPVVKEEDKRKVLLEVFKNQGALTHSLIDVLVDNKRTAMLSKVTQSYIQLYNDQMGIKEATVITAVPLTEELEAKVMAKVKELTESDTVTLKNEVDPEILGGFILRIGDVQYDASIINQFRKLRKEFKNQYN